MESGFPLIMLSLPLVAALLALALGRWPRAALGVGVVTLSLLTAVLWAASPTPGEGLLADNQAAIYERRLALTPLVRGLFLFVYPTVAALLALGWVFPNGRVTPYAALAMLSPLAAALMVEPQGLGAVLLAVALALLLPALHDARFAAAGAAWRYYLLAILGLVPLIAVVWFQTGGQGGTAVAALLLATLILFGGFPFHIGLRGLARTASPAALALTLGVAQLGVVAFLLAVLDAEPAARAAAEFQTALRGSAALTMLLAAFLVRREGEWRGIIAGVLLLDAGFLLASGLAPGAGGLAVALTALAGRTLSLLLIAAGLGLPAGATSEGSFWRRGTTLRLMLLTYGCLSLVGMPLTPGFAARWEQMAILAGGGPAAAALGGLLVLSLAMAGWAVARQAREKAASATTTVTAAVVTRGQWVTSLLLLGLAGLLGLWPGLLAAFAARLVGG